MSDNTSFVHFAVRKPGSRRSWLPYFLAAIGAGAAVADEELLRYHWVLPAEVPGDAYRTIRVQGEKGERYEEVYAEETMAALKQHPAIREARLARQAALRKEALELAQQLREAGKDPLVAYEEAWVQVYSRNWLNNAGLIGSCKLEDMLTRLADEGGEQELTDEEVQWLLEALLEDDDRLENEAGLELLRRLAAQLRLRGYGLSLYAPGVNDELMKQFADALQHHPDSMGAYRDALFKTHRDRIVTHTLTGYAAPWGMGVSASRHYRQAPLQVETTTASGNTQAPDQTGAVSGETLHETTGTGQVEIPGAVSDFLATAPNLSEEKEAEQEEDTETGEKTETTVAEASPMPMMRAFSMRSAAPVGYTLTRSDADSGEQGTTDTLYWNSHTADSGIWDTAQTQVWLDAGGSEMSYTAGSHVEFGEGAGLNKNVQIAEEGVEADAVAITGSGYQFSGGSLKVVESLSTTASASIGSSLVIGSTSSPLTIDVEGSSTLSVANLDTCSIQDEDRQTWEHGSFTKTGSGTLSITSAVRGIISGMIVQEGELHLGDAVTLDVGANRITGGSLENVQMLITGDIKRPFTGDTVTVHNLISSADGESAGVLRNVTLNAGTSTEYATLHNIVFAGQSSLTGYITFEKIQATGEISVAEGSKLTVNNLTFDLRGLAMGEKTLIVNEGGTLEGWNAKNVHFVYSGVKVNSAAVNVFENTGVISFSDDHEGNLYWNGADDNMWNTSSANWSSTDDGAGREAFTALSNVYFGELATDEAPEAGDDAADDDSELGDEIADAGGVPGDDAAGDSPEMDDAIDDNKCEISVVQDMVVAKLGVTAGGYSFIGARVAVLGNASLNPGEGDVTFNNQLVVQGSLSTAGPGSVSLKGAVTIAGNADFQSLTTTIAEDMTVGGKLTVASGGDGSDGSLTITGNVTAKEMELAVRAGAPSDNTLVNVSGNLSVGNDGLITIGGTAKQQYTGVVTAGKLVVNTTENDVSFSRVHVGKLTVGAGATVHMQTSADSVAVSSSDFPVVDLYGTLVLDGRDATYNRGYTVNVLNEQYDDGTLIPARLIFGSGTTIGNLKIIGKRDDNDTRYPNVAIEVHSSSATVTGIQNLGDLTVEEGSLTVNKAGGAVHGKLILDNGKLHLGADSDEIMASGSGEIYLKNGGRLDIGKTIQTLSAGNNVFLSGVSSITGDAAGPGLTLGNGVCVNYEDAGNSLDVQLNVGSKGDKITLNSTLLPGAEEPETGGYSLEITGHLNGSGDIELTGQGSVVLSGSNDNYYNGLVTVQKGSTLTLLHTDALTDAGVILKYGGTLALDTDSAVNLNALTLSDGSILAISSIAETDAFSKADAALHVGKSDYTGSLTLNVRFDETLKTMKTYNIMTGLDSIVGLSLNVTHHDVQLDASQYKIGFDKDTGLLYISTMMGNVWDGKGNETEGAGTGPRYWSVTNTDGNWSSGSGNYDESGEHRAAIFGDLYDDEASSVVYVQDCVTPGVVYLVADKTPYWISASQDDKGTTGHLADGTKIYKDGSADATLLLYGNMDASTALGTVEILSGNLILGESLAVSGPVTIAKDACLLVKGDVIQGVPVELKMGPNEDGSFNYTVSSILAGNAAMLSGVTMDAAGIWGTDKGVSYADKLLVQGTAHLSNLTLNGFAADEKVTLSNVTLTSSGNLSDVTIGSGVEVAADSSYTLSGNMVFEDTLLNNGTVTVADETHFEIGKLQYKPLDDTPLKAEYKYQLIDSGNNGTLTGQSFQASQISINGVNLGDGLNSSEIGVQFIDNKDGSITFSIGQYIYDEAGNHTGIDNSVGIPQWDVNWKKTDNAPSLSRMYTDDDAYVDLASGTGGKSKYYRYSSIVKTKNADNVNGANDAIVVTLAPGATGDFAVGGLVTSSVVTGAVPEKWYYVHYDEVWIEDRSAIRSVIGGLDNKLGEWTGSYQAAATHILIDSAYDVNNPDLVVSDWRTWDKSYVIAGSRWCNQEAESFVTVRSGEIYNIFGASCDGHYSGACYEYKSDYDWEYDEPCTIRPNEQESWWHHLIWGVIQTGTSHVYVEGGRIGEIFAGGFFSTLDVGEGNRAVEMVLSGGILGGENEQLRVFGGADHGTVTGDIYVRMEGTANILSILVGGSNAGTVNGDIVLDLISGTANKVEAPGKGWAAGETATIKGDIWVNLYSDFELGQGIVDGVYVDAGLYGGKEKSNFVNIAKDGCYSRLHFAEGKVYDLASVVKEVDDTSDNQKIKIGDTSEDSIIVTGFDRFELENKAHVVLGLGLFDADMDPEKGASTELVISGKGVVEVIGHGLVYEAPILGDYGTILGYKTENARNFWRDIRLEESATLMISTSSIGAAGIGDDRTIYVQDGTTIDFSGATLNTEFAGEGLGIKVEICGNGVDGKGAIYKGSYEESRYPTTSTSVDRIILPKVWLTGNASVNVESGETLHMNAYANDSEKAAYTEDMEYMVWKDLDLAGNTFTKFGAGDFITNLVDMTPGTILVQEGAFGFGVTGKTDDVDMVLAAGSELKLNATKLESADKTSLTLRSLSGAGAVKLNGSTLTLNTDDRSFHHEEYMTDAEDNPQAYDQFSETTGFGYAVFSGLISDGSGAGKVAKNGDGVHYITGSSSTYTGGTRLQEGRLYLLGTSEASTFTRRTSTVSSGVAGRGAIVWDSADAELYLGHGTRIYNKGTTGAQGGFMTIGVEGVPSDAVLANFVGIHSVGGKTVTMGNVEYVEIDTHNLRSINVDAVYADGTAYARGEDIDRSKMLLIRKSDWDTVKNDKDALTVISDGGYNEAVYSGVLANTDNVAAGLRKVGAGTLVLDQNNTYTGGTRIEAGTLRLRGWATLGNNAKANAASVESGATLMFTHNGGYVDEPASAANHITLNGTGDARWDGNAATDGGTAALISAVGPEVRFTLSGDISGSGNVLHSGDGTLVLSGDSSYTGGTVITRGEVEVQSATGLGSTADGQGAVVLDLDADLHFTVENGTGGGRLVTTLASKDDNIKGDVYIAGTKSVERVLHMEGNGYDAATTTLGDKGTFLLCGMPTGETGVSSHSGQLTGSGLVVVSDAIGSGATARFDSMVDYTGDFRVEGNKAAIQVDAGSYIDGSIEVAGQQASIEIGGNVSIAAGETLLLRSTGVVPTQLAADGTPEKGSGAVLISHGAVSVAADAVLSVRRSKTYYNYDLSELQNEISLTPDEVVLPQLQKSTVENCEYIKLGEKTPDYSGRFDTALGVNQQAVAGIKANDGLTLAGGSTYDARQGHISLMGGSLKFDTLENNQITLRASLDYLWLNEEDDAQLVLFSDVSSVTFVYDKQEITATADSGIYYTRADQYLTGSDYINRQTMLVYDSHAKVVYLQIKTPEPTTTALGLVALAALAARRRRKRD